ncbi:uncharacterized protein DUF397 [Saccharopolyspora erythraea NRRL 2338]|uniref:DUF397 domain-containing protein n=1 Tax=Saccharopolyspora erythraea TaxID=1836 RepID=A0ABP3M0A5_SACER|nr:DUF397 domain-containing protein [Saccharopolyspora erythraea]EQD87325.1 hypothetical protein N599_04610 [Saccharopolyspora erythraea D]PFG94531.1 uncharacterized protein DUF397 [Saccharopolyspora erythraea NRRL 2338]QRK91279.1 DUF397 domain-containing protein [Saccharopolyspora erythraea]
MTLRPTGWRKSSHSARHTDCVEVGRVCGGAAVRDSKDRSSRYFAASDTQWRSFVVAVKSGRFDF